jgi:hypothetical protein
MARPRRLDPAVPLKGCPEQQVGVSLPSPLNARLTALVAAAEANGERTTRKELLAALVLAAPSDGAELGGLLREFRSASARQACVEGSSLTHVLTVRPRRPGPAPRAGGRTGH